MWWKYIKCEFIRKLLWKKKDRSFGGNFEGYALFLSLSSHEYVSIMFSISCSAQKRKKEKSFMIHPTLQRFNNKDVRRKIKMRNALTNPRFITSYDNAYSARMEWQKLAHYGLSGYDADVIVSCIFFVHSHFDGFVVLPLSHAVCSSW